MIRQWATPTAILLSVLLALPTHAAKRVVAFGDSITEGVGDTSSPRGYPPKLERILRDAGVDARVENFGFPGETTFEALSRIESALSGGGDYFVLLEGTNDVSLIEDGLLSVESVISNLETLGTRARSRGFEAVLGTLLPRPRSARKDRDNAITREVSWEIYELAASKNRAFADIWTRFNPFFDIDVFRTLYSSPDDDPVGHPNKAGYEVMASLFADQILEIDTLAPVPGRFSPFAFEIDGLTDFEAAVFESAGGAGIKLNQTFFEFNGERVAKPIKSQSNRRRAQFRFTANRKQIGCRVVLGVSGRDLADPPNDFAQLIWAYDVAGRDHMAADIDGDCTVNRGDLDQLNRGFGARFGDPTYSILLDFNSDDVIDGRDLAILATDFGKKS